MLSGSINIMKNLILTLVITLSTFTFVSARADKCFQSGWLQQHHSITFSVKGTAVTGTFSVTRDDEKTDYQFTGTKNGSTITVRFAGGKVPDVAPSEMRNFVWTLAAKPDREVLRIKVYGKNYDTNKYATNTAEYDPCPTLSMAPATGEVRPVVFAKGQTSSKINISFSNDDHEMSYSVSARKGQVLFVEAYGCSITVRMPDGKDYYYLENPGDAKSGKNATALDVQSINSLPQTGTYIIKLKNAGGDPKRSRDVRFEITNPAK